MVFQEEVAVVCQDLVAMLGVVSHRDFISFKLGVCGPQRGSGGQRGVLAAVQEGVKFLAASVN